MIRRGGWFGTIKFATLTGALLVGMSARLPILGLAGVILLWALLFLPSFVMGGQRWPSTFLGTPVPRLPDDVAAQVLPAMDALRDHGFSDWVTIEAPFLAVTSTAVLLRHRDGARVATVSVVRGRNGLQPSRVSLGNALAGPDGLLHLVEVTGEALPPTSRPPTVHLSACPGADVPRLIAQLDAASAEVSRSLDGATPVPLPEDSQAMLRYEHQLLTRWRIERAGGRDEGTHHRLGERDAIISGMSVLPGVSQLLRWRQRRAADALLARTHGSGPDPAVQDPGGLLP